MTIQFRSGAGKPHACIMNNAMIAAFDVHYTDSGLAYAAAVIFHDYGDESPACVLRRQVPVPAAYVPGSFYKRELPCLLSLIGQMTHRPDEMVVDGYVWLGKRPGLGQHLFEALERTVPVIGVAKSAFISAPGEPLYRGQSRRPLYITAAGMAIPTAVANIERMHGSHRIPTLLKQVDLVARGTVACDAQ